MATYITLINFTNEGVRKVKDTANRASHYKELAAKLGCTVKENYWTQGQYDVVSIVEAPNDASMTALAMSVGKLGYIRTQTLRAFSAAELAPIMEVVEHERRTHCRRHGEGRQHAPSLPLVVRLRPLQGTREAARGEFSSNSIEIMRARRCRSMRMTSDCMKAVRDRQLNLIFDEQPYLGDTCRSSTSA